MLKRDLTRAVKKKRPELCKFYLHHNSATPHTSAITKTTQELDIKTIPHPACSPDQAPFDLWLFATIKMELRRSQFHKIQDLPVVVQECIRRKPAETSKAVLNHGLINMRVV